MSQTTFIEPEIKKSAVLSPCGTYRYLLRRWWSEKITSTVCWIMLNPSTADASIDDPTIKRCIHFSRAWGYGGMVVVNLFPYRSPSPEKCREWADWESSGPDWGIRDTIHYRNQPLIEKIAKESTLVVAAWGAGEWYQQFAEHVAEEIQSNEAPWPNIYCLGLSKSGTPKHPMARGKHRVPDDQQPILWLPA